jgi:hypothetical protein
MAPEHAFDVEGRGVEWLCDCGDLGRFDEKEDSVRIDEPPNEPGAGDAIDLGPLTRHPNRATLWTRRRDGGGTRHQTAVGLPRFDTACQAHRVNAIVTKPRGDCLADLAAISAHNDDRPICKAFTPIADR